jgi:peptidoglycan/xylan/chitin deacetylase (PgdA/CDA1 family)
MKNFLFGGMKLLTILAVFAVCFVVAFYGSRIYMMMQQEKEVAATTGGAVEAGKDELSSIVEDYRRAEESAKLAAESGATDAAGNPAAAARKTPAGPVRTPDPANKLIREHGTGRKWVALTFDDGPHPEYTPQFMELLKSKNVRATFFLLGPMVKNRPELAKQLVDSGFEVANHSWKHPTLSKLSPDAIREELQKTTDIITEATGAKVELLRPPYGSANKKVQDICDELGLRIITWNIDTDDWRKETTADKMTSTVMTNLRDGSIILMHDRSDKAFETTANVIDMIREKGYEFVTVGELIGLRAEGQPQAKAGEGGAAPPAQKAAPEVADAAPQSTPAAAAAAPAATQQPVAIDLPRPSDPQVRSQSASATAAAPAAQPASATQAGGSAPEVSPDRLTQPPVSRSR